MKNGGAGLARKREEICIAGAIRFWRALFGNVAEHCRLTHDPAQKLHSGQDGVAVMSPRKVARLIAGGSLGSADLMRTKPRLSGRN